MIGFLQLPQTWPPHLALVTPDQKRLYWEAMERIAESPDDPELA